MTDLDKRLQDMPAVPPKEAAAYEAGYEAGWEDGLDSGQCRFNCRTARQMFIDGFKEGMRRQGCDDPNDPRIQESIEHEWLAWRKRQQATPDGQKEV